MKQRIAALVYGQYPSDSRVRRQAEALVRNGYEVDVVALCSDPGKWSYVLNGVHVHQLPLQKKRGGALRYIFQYCAFMLLSFSWLTVLYIRKRHAVIHVNNMPNIIVYSAIVPKLCGARIILDMHDPFPELYAAKAMTMRGGGLALKLLRLEERMSVAFADHVICTTDLIRDVVIQRGARRNKTSVLLNSPDTELFRRKSRIKERPVIDEQQSFVVLYAGTVAERYGVSNIVSALALLKDDIPGLKFRVIGEGKGSERLKAQARELQAEDILEVLPGRRVDEIPQEYERADALLWFPKRNSFIDIILCVKVLEALAMGVPVVSTRTRSHSYYFSSDEVTFVDSLEPSHLASAVLDLYTNYESRKPTAEETERFVETFGWGKEQGKYFRTIKDLVRGDSWGSPVGQC